MALDCSMTLDCDDGQPAGSIELVDAGSIEAWRARQDAATLHWADVQRFAGKADETLLMPHLDGGTRAVAGVGSIAALGPWALAALVGRLPAGAWRVTPDVADLSLAALGWALAHYRFDRYRKTGEDARRRVLLLPPRIDLADLRRQVRAITLVRDLVNTPAGDLGPAALADAALAVASRHGAKADVIVGDALLAEGWPAVHAVGRAAADAPRLIDIRWGDPAHPLLCLVGKGVCFDSGGLDIKGASGMALMKKDMGGAAHALALADMVMDARLPVSLRLLIPAVENAISGNAFRPGDVLATRTGLSVEVGNTDAEGRLILCDALAEADAAKPALLLDFATLTGAARVALGPDLPALFTPDDALAHALMQAGEQAQDPMWRLPLWAPYADYLKSNIADINNAGDSGFAGAITAALFLQRFVANTTAWAHVDLFAWSPAAKPGRPKGGEAMTLRACWALIRGRFPAA